jgi:DNA-directed RNA polymerase specialized sigma24 family protein
MPPSPGDRLSRISTMWTVLRAAHGGPPDAAGAAKQLLLERYGPAVRRYLAGLLRDPHAADDLTQEFALLVVSGKFHGADPARGRFRNYVKSTLFHLVSGHARGQKRQPMAVAPDDGVLAGLAASAEDDRAFSESWRTELVTRTWAALADANPGYHAVLRLRADHPDASSDELAARTRPPMTPANLRQTLKRARELFASLLREEVRHTLENPTADAVDEELADLDLLKYTRV